MVLSIKQQPFFSNRTSWIKVKAFVEVKKKKRYLAKTPFSVGVLSMHNNSTLDENANDPLSACSFGTEHNLSAHGKQEIYARE